jgi:hypothetical protein
MKGDLSLCEMCEPSLFRGHIFTYYLNVCFIVQENATYPPCVQISRKGFEGVQ